MDFFAPLIGQTQAVELLKQAVAKDRIAPAYLFVGSPGIGRSLAARCFLELLFSQNNKDIAVVKSKLEKSNHPDLLWVQPSYQHQGKLFSAKEAAEKGLKRKAPPIIRLEQIREITEFLSRPPLETSRNIVILEQAETMAESAANALLKTLEEPGKATLILIAPTPDSILTTLVSRCQKIPFYCLDTAAMSQVLALSGHSEILNHPTVISIAAGSPGKAIEAYEQMQNIPLDLLRSCSQPPKTYRSALELAKQIDKALDNEAQLWLVDYLQQSYWQNLRQPIIIQQLEKTRKSLLCYAQPRLVWECMFLSLVVSR
ncbi:DNA polymerase III, gamma/tau subunit [Rivularia sp. PCC 7116]|uniref:DNA polymerase III subunit delta' n=1 Tax=Rivularia sp. PCC 7116 TaxID=373994 RepID=UPI00029F2A34|nr:DNA polymerase III subunit delta' [Rivularia sp. PCC 7116]AFY52930.1 DNA polymerase III, gamma/tau subunit [Rivularia sp. PCC 7116]